MAKTKFHVVHSSPMVTSESIEDTLPWPRAWREAARLNDLARKDFQEGRRTYDVPEFRCEEVKRHG